MVFGWISQLRVRWCSENEPDQPSEGLGFDSRLSRGFFFPLKLCMSPHFIQKKFEGYVSIRNFHPGVFFPRYCIFGFGGVVVAHLTGTREVWDRYSILPRLFTSSETLGGLLFHLLRGRWVCFHPKFPLPGYFFWGLEYLELGSIMVTRPTGIQETTIGLPALP